MVVLESVVEFDSHRPQIHTMWPQTSQFNVVHVAWQPRTSSFHSAHIPLFRRETIDAGRVAVNVIHPLHESLSELLSGQDRAVQPFFDRVTHVLLRSNVSREGFQVPHHRSV